jgi:regulator of protease activity HflC (stomatin/prohibitin superfamily)
MSNWVMKYVIIPLLLSAVLMTGCASNLQSSGSGSASSSGGIDPVTLAGIQQSNDASAAANTAAQTAIDQANAQAASDAANAAAQAANNAAQAAAQETMNNANNSAPSN